MSWSINEVARMSGITSRTLRHYQTIRLLEPESTEFAGRRIYGQRELLRLQEILLLRDLGLPLKTVAVILDADDRESRGEALRSHLDWLTRERDRLDRLIRTVEKTIDEGDRMTPQQIFEGIHENPYEAEARERWGDEIVDDSKERLAKLTPAEIDRLKGGFDEIHRKVEALHAEGLPVDDPRVTEVIREHHAIVSLTWVPDAAGYAGLGRLYVEDSRFRGNIGRGNDEMVEFLRDAMAHHAVNHLPAG